ncbi:hypothetical protein N7512_001329 [Penicillium capsulatum]|nr:hypothetical protein N7512_001329 [Penicillium capsulatum]
MSRKDAAIVCAADTRRHNVSIVAPAVPRRTLSTAASDRSDEVQVHNGILSMSTMDILRGQEYNPTNKTYTSPSAPAPPGESATQAQYARAIFARMAFELLELPTEMLEQLLGYLQAEIGRRSQQ